LRDLCRDVVGLRRLDQNAQWLRLQKERQAASPPNLPPPQPTAPMPVSDTLAPRRGKRARERTQPAKRLVNCAHELRADSSPSPPQTCGGEGRGEEVPNRFMGRGSFLRRGSAKTHPAQIPRPTNNLNM
jgi:hypothetical protein